MEVRQPPPSMKPLTEKKKMDLKRDEEDRIEKARKAKAGARDKVPEQHAARDETKPVEAKRAKTDAVTPVKPAVAGPSSGKGDFKHDGNLDM